MLLLTEIFNALLHLLKLDLFQLLLDILHIRRLLLFDLNLVEN